MTGTLVVYEIHNHDPQGHRRSERTLLFDGHRNVPWSGVPQVQVVGVTQFYWSSNRWLRPWLQASVIAEACDINGSSLWEFSNTSNRSPHSHAAVKRRCADAAGRFSCGCFYPQRYKGEWCQIDWGTRCFFFFFFFDSPLKWNGPLWIARSTRWLFPWGEDSQAHLGIYSRYLCSCQMITFKSLSQECSRMHHNFGQLGILINTGI